MGLSSGYPVCCSLLFALYFAMGKFPKDRMSEIKGLNGYLACSHHKRVIMKLMEGG